MKSVFIQQIFTDAKAGMIVHAGNANRTDRDYFKGMRFPDEQLLIQVILKMVRIERLSRGNDWSSFCEFKYIIFVFAENHFTHTSSF